MRQEPDSDRAVVASKNGSRDDKFARLVAYLERLRLQNFTGNIRINWTQGRIGRIEKYEEVLK
ncbi:MAG: hypothetical protein PVF51_05885 [Nitrospirota bacterium]|jgi:hypothetical protein